MASFLDSLADYLFPQAALHQIESHSTSESISESDSTSENFSTKETQIFPSLTEKEIALKVFQKIALQYEDYDFSTVSHSHLNAMTRCLTSGFKLCQNKKLYERWALEIMPGCLKNLKRIENKKLWKHRNVCIIMATKINILNKSEDLAHIVNALDANQITVQSAKTILKEILAGNFTESDIGGFLAKDKIPASTEEVEKEVALFLRNIKFYVLREKIENVIFRYFIQCRFRNFQKTKFQEKTFCKNSSRVLKDIRQIVQRHGLVELIQSKDLENIYKASVNTYESSKYYRTTLEGIFKMLTLCLELADKPLSNNISYISFNSYTRKEMNFICQPIMGALNNKTTGNEIMKAYKKLSEQN